MFLDRIKGTFVYARRRGKLCFLFCGNVFNIGGDRTSDTVICWSEEINGYFSVIYHSNLCCVKEIWIRFHGNDAVQTCLKCSSSEKSAGRLMQLCILMRNDKYPLKTCLDLKWFLVEVLLFLKFGREKGSDKGVSPKLDIINFFWGSQDIEFCTLRFAYWNLKEVTNPFLSNSYLAIVMPIQVLELYYLIIVTISGFLIY